MGYLLYTKSDNFNETCGYQKFLNLIGNLKEYSPKNPRYKRCFKNILLQADN